MIHFRRGALQNIERAGIAPRTPEGTLLAKAISALASADTVPAPGDYRAIIPPVMPIWAHRVVGSGLWLYYSCTADDLTVWGVVRYPPAPFTPD